MRSLVAVIILAITSGSWAKDVSFDLATIDRSLSNIEPHVRQYLLRFSSSLERNKIEQELKQVLILLDTAVKSYPDDPDILFRDGFANAMGHNLDYPGCDQKAIAAYEHLLKLQPESKRANFYYGGFPRWNGDTSKR